MIDEVVDVFMFRDQQDAFKDCHITLPPTTGSAGAIGSVLLQQEGSTSWTPVKCGSVDGLDLDQVVCQSLTSKGADALTWPQVGSALLLINNGTSLWVTGGDSTTTNNGSTGPGVSGPSRIINSTGWSWGPHLPPRAYQHHCMVGIGASKALTIGGLAWDIFNKNHQPKGATWQVDIDTLAWSFVHYLAIPRWRHACGVVKDRAKPWTIVVVAGGQTGENGEITASVELLQFPEATGIQDGTWWQDGQQLPVAVKNAATATTSNQQRLFVIGSGLIQEIQCSDTFCSWTVHDHELKPAMSSPFAMVVPPPTPLLGSSEHLALADGGNGKCCNLQNGAPPGKQY